MSALVPPQSTACSPNRSVSVSSRNVVFEYTGTRAADSFCPRQSRLLRVSAAILMNCNQRGYAATVHEFSTHHRSQSLRRDHHHIHIFARDNRPVVNREAVREEQSLTGTQV